MRTPRQGRPPAPEPCEYRSFGHSGRPNPDWIQAVTHDQDGMLVHDDCGQPAEKCLAVYLYGHRKSGCQGIIHTATGKHECGHG